MSLLVAGYDDQGPQLYQVDPSGSYFAWKASAIGKNMTNAKTFLEKRYSDEMEIEARARARRRRGKPPSGEPAAALFARGSPRVRSPGGRLLRFLGAQDAVHTAILTLKEGLEGQITGHNIEIGVVGEDRKFRSAPRAALRVYFDWPFVKKKRREAVLFRALTAPVCHRPQGSYTSGGGRLPQ